MPARSLPDVSGAVIASGSDESAGVDVQLLDGARAALAWLLDPSAASGQSATDDVGRVQRLRDALYAQWYVVPAAPKALQLAAVPHLESLRAAHAGSWTWEDGWRVEAVSSAGRVVVRRGDTSRLLWPGDYVSTHTPGAVPGPGDEVHAVARYDSSSLIDGFWVTYSRDWFAARGLLTRLYWNVLPSGAAALVRHVTTGLGDADYCLKLPLDPAAFARPDAGVLYLRAGAFAARRSVLDAIHQRTSPWLCDEVPKMSKRLAPGLGAAESAAEASESFGQHRCRLIGEGVIDCVARGAVSAPELLAAVKSRFEQDGIDPARPWLASSGPDGHEF